MKYAPLRASFMLTAIIGFLISAFLQPINPTWTFTFCLFFVLMFVASMIAMVEASPDAQLSSKPFEVDLEKMFK